MNSIDMEDRVEKIKKLVKYGVLIIPVVILMVVVLKGCNNRSYRKVESEVEKKAIAYVKEKNIKVSGEKYIELTLLSETEGTELCYKSSGVIVRNNKGTLEAEAYLECEDYESTIVKNKNKYIELKGKPLMVLNYGEVYNDPMYEFKRDCDVQIEGYVGKEAGIYTIKYYVYVDDELKETLTRKVVVVKADKTVTISGIENKVAPTLTLYGNKEMILYKGEKYVEPGYKAVDYVDGKISRKVKVSPKTISTNKTGPNIIYYSVTNSKGVTVVEKRIVTVVERKSDLTINLSKSTEESTKELKIRVNITGEGYERTIYPIDEVRSNYEYSVTANGKYSFEIIDTYGNKYVKEIVVANIDNVGPKGTCKAIVSNSSTAISVEASDDKGISGYSYIIDGKASEYITNNSYDTSVLAERVQVKLKDLAGNESTIPCELEKRLFDADGIRVTLSGHPQLKIPLETALAQKGYTIDDFNKCIYDRVKIAGPGTRYRVVAAAYGLIDCNKILTGYVLSYDHTGGKVTREVYSSTHAVDYCELNSSICGKLGVNTNWGKFGGTCNSGTCYYGLNCATFVRWSMCNGGMDLCDKGSAGASSMASKNYFPEADGVVITGKSVRYYSGNNLTNHSAAELVRMIKPGDIAFRERVENGSSQHTFVIIGRDDTGIYTANDGFYMNKITYDSIMNGEYHYRILFLDNYYANPNNQNSFYK